MPTYKIAHIHEQGVDMIIVPLDSVFGSLPRTEQDQIIADLELCANTAGAKGLVVPCWKFGGAYKFIAPPNWHPFFNDLCWEDVLLNLNKELTIP